ncbi:glycosyltransferase family 4 protein [Leptolyngbya sp. GGD]|uniref:glycosyltransferase family 4 protein n=1 Tax=Leptolyngbya sp. GGD TaxID=2997907 RepID=UPI00227BE407|nr:glycosyltransferase family 4 protein [Leptolyngbya sp. GGD]MCY6491505.1 glycosyltransferase family 4 protein [Leptolyngbya sp. GGD]
MQVLHFNQTDVAGGAALAGYRLHQGLLDQKIDSRFLVARKVTQSDLVTQLPSPSRTERRIQSITDPFGLAQIHLLSTFNLKQHPSYQSADLLNFHNLHDGYFNYLAIAHLTQPKPAVLTLHDMWSMTGHCSFSYDCDRWKIGCGNCPDLTIFPPMQRDSSHWEWNLKKWAYHKARLTIVAPSRWLETVARESPLFRRFAVHHIPYGIDVDVYKPLDPEYCRSRLNLPKDKRVLLFVATHLQERRKGGDLVLAALQQLPDAIKSQLVLVTFGSGDTEQTGIQTVSLGYIQDDAEKAIVYSAADLLVFPTRADNLPLVLQESLACGTPMISCRVGGVPDLVRPNVTGYLANSEDVQDLKTGILVLLENDRLRQQMRENCRTIAVSEYRLELQAQRYIELYQTLLNSIDR